MAERLLCISQVGWAIVLDALEESKISSGEELVQEPWIYETEEVEEVGLQLESSCLQVFSGHRDWRERENWQDVWEERRGWADLSQAGRGELIRLKGAKTKEMNTW